MANNNQNQNQKGNQNPVKNNPQNNPSVADLANALGTTVPEAKKPETPPAPAPVANKPAEAPTPSHCPLSCASGFRCIS